MSLYNQVLELSVSYFTSSTEAERFFARQCKHHLNREPAELGPHDLWKLAEWTMISATLLIGKERAEELSNKIRELRRSMGAVPLRGPHGN